MPVLLIDLSQQKKQRGLKIISPFKNFFFFSPSHKEFTLMLPIQTHLRHFNLSSPTHPPGVSMFFSSPTPGYVKIFCLLASPRPLPKFLGDGGFLCEPVWAISATCSLHVGISGGMCRGNLPLEHPSCPERLLGQMEPKVTD